jgi:hypothetical protein
MDKKTVLKFGDKSQTVMFVFATGKESDIYESKEEALHEMADMVIRKKIKAEEVGALTEEIMNSSLPRKEKRSSVGMHIVAVSIAGMLSSEASVIQQRAENLFSDVPSDKSDQLLIRMCGCGGKHALMLIQSEETRGYAGLLRSKEDCREALAEVKGRVRISDELEQQFLAQVENLPLPETHDGEAEKEKTGAAHANA